MRSRCLPEANLGRYAFISGVARQPEAQQRMFVPFLITVGLVEAAFFINVAFMALFVFATPGL